jgi:hypothetical protein
MSAAYRSHRPRGLRPSLAFQTKMITDAVSSPHWVGLTAHRSSGLEVRFGSKADIASGSRHVRFTPKSGHASVSLDAPFGAGSQLASFGLWFGRSKRR